MTQFTACELRRELISAEQDQSTAAKRYAPETFNALAYQQVSLILRRILVQHARTCAICQAEAQGPLVLAREEARERGPRG